MTLFEFIKESKSIMPPGTTIELRDLIDEHTFFGSNYEGMVKFLDREGMEYLSDATFVMGETDNKKEHVTLYYIKDIKEYDEYDLRQFATKLTHLERQNRTLEARIANAVERSERIDPAVVGKNDIIKE